MSAKTEIGLKIANLLAVKGWSETELATRSGLTQSTVHRIISGESQSPRLANVSAIAKAFNVSVAYLTTGETESGKSPAAMALITLIEEKSRTGDLSDEYLTALAELLRAK